MKKIFHSIFLGAVFLCLFSLKANTAGEYIILSKKGITQEKIKQILLPHTPELIRPLGKGQFFVKFTKDPGLEKLQKVVKKHLVIQRNFNYKALKKESAKMPIKKSQ